MLEYRAILYNICGMIAPSCAYLSLLTIFFIKEKKGYFLTLISSSADYIARQSKMLPKL